MIYLDYAATTPMSNEALEAYQHVARNYYGNSSSLHDTGTTAADLLETCRGELARLISGQKEGIYFTSGGSEANLLAIRTLLKGCGQNGKHIITTATEHASIHSLCKTLEKEGYEVTWLPVDSNGIIALSQLRAALREDTCLVSVHHANSETGILQPLEAIGELLKEKNIHFHSDCVQTFGKIPIDVEKLHLTSISISSHKIYGPKGVGALYIDPKATWKSIYEGASHEKGMRPGTVDIPGIASFLTAAQQMEASMEDIKEKYETMRIHFLRLIQQSWLPVVVEGERVQGLPHILGLRIPGIEGQHVMLECNRRGIAISTGSACQMGSQSPSRTMIATGKTPDEAREFIRLSFGKQTTIRDLELAFGALKEIIEEQMKRSG
ncbi:aminotransferase class V-fold PLP-dependent enzyme [Sutcliffiella horikoshii]|uniref:Aminotransferase class V-fold PLP-dependent enzyme n=1 Tax=Sutcliffiella horikoshii TaxID=79883 RepID=A0A5D4T2P7_9BACI|nr:IscS subfamily cysteine desulfurase [Sutcliffiella horikoshii]TYS68918.1 aminotransferase class V-fold PLP-dependent enzyme [Sutcliffiella horikoshii]